MNTPLENKREDYIKKYGHDPIPCDKCKVSHAECVNLGCPYGYDNLSWCDMCAHNPVCSLPNVNKNDTCIHFLGDCEYCENCDRGNCEGCFNHEEWKEAEE